MGFYMKTCSCCKELKPFSDFSLNKSKKSGYSSECKPCHRIKRKRYYESNKTSEKARVKASKELKRSQYVELKSKLSCQICSEGHPATLQFHHLDPQEKEFEIADAFWNGLSLEKIKVEIAKCVVLCANCHAKEHYSIREFGKSLLV